MVLVDSSVQGQLGDGQSIHSGAIGAGIESIGNTLVVVKQRAIGCRRSSPPTAATTTARLLFYSQSVGVDQQLSTSSSQGTWNISSEFVEKRVFKGVLLDVCM
jgi:hypothetical protein